VVATAGASVATTLLPLHPDPAAPTSAPLTEREATGRFASDAVIFVAVGERPGAGRLLHRQMEGTAAQDAREARDLGLADNLDRLRTLRSGEGESGARRTGSRGRSGPSIQRLKGR
jgi:hypothetical protein